MFSTLIFAFEAVFPLVFIIFLGYWFRRIGLFSEEFLSKGYSFSFRVALPCLLFCNVYSIESLSDIDFRTVLYTMAVVILLFVIGTMIAVSVIPDKRQRGVVVQCFFRSNCAILGISLTESLGGASALQCAAVVTAFTIPLFNILAVVSLSVFCGEKREGRRGLLAIDWKDVCLKIAKNPLIIGVCLGLLCLVVRSFIPVNGAGEKVFLLSKQLGFLYSVVQSLAKIASPFMLLVLGGQFTFSAVKRMKKQILIGTTARILLAPVLAIGLGYLLSECGVLSLGTSEYATFIAVFATPVAVSSAIMAREMGNDDILAGQLVVWTSIGSVFTIFLLATLLRLLGFL
ncbi:MAG: AEC family transporter [Clostridia bacterium]|nr:AEC family transporter [Clostridia bacterium]